MASSRCSKPRCGPVECSPAKRFSGHFPSRSKAGSKWAFPIRAVRYPFPWRWAATLGASMGSGTPLANTPWVRGYCPVIMVLRAGMHTTFWAMARRKLMPARARPSATGVRAMVPPLHPRLSYRCWSVVTKRIFRPMPALYEATALRSHDTASGREDGEVTRPLWRSGRPQGTSRVRPVPSQGCEDLTGCIRATTFCGAAKSKDLMRRHDQ